jgi:DNA-binding LacI/PurR family transcriptional regulator/DNA-binding transcriptional regulator YhcF (GntR family)
MTLMRVQVPRIVELADLIAKDIAERKLKPGDPYQSTMETAEMLGVGTTAANRAMQVLVKRRLLERRQRKGTFVAMPTEYMTEAPLRRVHLLVQENYLRMEGVLSDGIVVGMHEELPTAQLQFNFLPPDNEAQYVSGLIAEALKSGQGEGFVLVRASLQTQRLIAGGGLPAVVHGLLHPSVPRIPWIDRDHRQAGRLLVGHLLNNGMRRVLMMTRDRMFQGDHQALDSTRDTMAEAGLPLNALTVRCMPSDHEAIKAAAVEWLAGLKEPGGVVCRSLPLAKGVAAAAESIGRKVGHDVMIVLADLYRKGSEPAPGWPYLKSMLTPEQIGQHIGRMLAQQARGQVADPDHEIIPVRLEV